MKLPVLDKEVQLPELPVTVTLKGQEETTSTMQDVGLLVLRLTTGGLLVGHGAQKLFGWFSGPGLKGTAGWLESMGLTPGKVWATAASSSEFGGGLLTSLGLLHPLGPIAEMSSMLMATFKAHWGKPIWVTTGGAELPVTNMASAVALVLTGPGRFSLDHLFGIRLPRPVAIGVAASAAAITVIGVLSKPAPAPTAAEMAAADEAVPASQINGTL